MASNSSFYDPSKRKHVVFSARAAGYLQDRGHKIVDIGMDRKNPRKDAYVFTNSKELHKDLDDFIKLRQDEKKKYT